MRVFITSIGSSPALDVARCLRRDPSLELIGGDASEWGRKVGGTVCSDVVELPRADRGATHYVDALERALDVVDADFLFVCLDVEVRALCEAEHDPSCPHALPAREYASIFLDKSRTQAAGPTIDFPSTFDVDPQVRTQVREAMEAVGGTAWIRPSEGTSGQGSLKAESLQDAWDWMSMWRRRGVTSRWTVQEYLPGRNVNWSGLYVDGRCVAHASMERLEYYLANIAVSGVTGQVRRCLSIRDEDVRTVADRVVRHISPDAHGLFSVDLRFDRDDRPRVNEINPRLAGRPLLFAEAGSNLPLAAVRELRGESLGDAVSVSGGEPGIEMYRQLDVQPFFRVESVPG